MNIVITGGSRGIGAAAVRLFAARGHRVRVLYEKNHAAARAVAAQTGAEGFGPVDVLINNAGIAHYGLISQIGKEHWDRMFAVNVHGMYHCIDAVLPGMLQNQSGCIINVSSMWGQVGASMEVCYSATKGAVIALTKALAKELGPSHIRVNCIAPRPWNTWSTPNLSPARSCRSTAAWSFEPGGHSLRLVQAENIGLIRRFDQQERRFFRIQAQGTGAVAVHGERTL